MPAPFYLSGNTIATPEFRNFPSAYGVAPKPVIPVAGCCSWFVAHADPDTASNGGSAVTRVDSLTGASHRPFPCAGATTARFRLRYDPSGAQTTTGPPVVSVIGFDKNGVPELLSDAAGATQFTLAVAASDVASAANAYYTAPVEVDLKNNEYAVLVVVTAATGTAFTDADAAILGKLL